MAKMKSFTLYLAPGETLTPWPTPYPTPWPTPCPSASQDLAYEVVGTARRLDPEIMRKWFLQSIVPLVGQKAGKVMDALIRGEKGASGKRFLNEAINFRRALK